MKKIEQLRFWILVSIVTVSGFSQGMLLPLISIIFEKSGINSSLNGLNATAMYIGVLIASPLIEAPLRKVGYKPLILVGGFTVFFSLLLFSSWKSFWFWFFLRLLIGIGDHILHFATQTWITSSSPKEKLGRNISLYGFFFSLGFAVGPAMTRLVEINERLPFILTSIISLIIWLAIFALKNDYPVSDIETVSFLGTFKRFGLVWKYAWVSLLPPFGFGFLEACLNSSFPIYALKNGMNIDAVSLIIPAFAIGSIVFQLPLGMLSDRLGRHFILKWVMFIGFMCFGIAALYRDSPVILFVSFFVAGMAVGSTFSLGISFMADLLPKNLLPAGNIMCGIFYSIACMIGPFFSGLLIQYVKGPSFFYLLSLMLFIIFISLVAARGKQNVSSVHH